MKAIKIVPLIFISLNLYSQIYLTDKGGFEGNIFANSEGVKQFQQASELIKLGEYKAADSLFTMALCTFKNQNVYYNRGISRLLMGDSSKCCNDLEIAANDYYDEQAAKMFCELCCTSVDSLRYNRKWMLANEENKTRYIEEIRRYKFEDKTMGIIHDLHFEGTGINSDHGCQQNVIGIKFISSV